MPSAARRASRGVLDTSDRAWRRPSGNVVVTRAGPLLVDFDLAGTAPAMWDLTIPVVHHRRFGTPGDTRGARCRQPISAPTSHKPRKAIRGDGNTSRRSEQPAPCGRAIRSAGRFRSLVACHRQKHPSCPPGVNRFPTCSRPHNSPRTPRLSRRKCHYIGGQQRRAEGAGYSRRVR